MRELIKCNQNNKPMRKVIYLAAYESEIMLEFSQRLAEFVISFRQLFGTIQLTFRLQMLRAQVRKLVAQSLRT